MDNLQRLVNTSISLSKKLKFEVEIYINRDSTHFKFRKKELATSISFSNKLIDDIVDIKLLRNKIISVIYDLYEMLKESRG